MLLLLLPLLVSACHTISAWDQGFPDRGDDPALFALEEMNDNYVVVHGKRYSRATFDPIFKHATPDVGPALADADALAADLTLVGTGLITAITYVVPQDWPRYVSRIRDGVVVASYAVDLYLIHRVRDAYAEVTEQYNKALRRHLGAK
jgi:hypothetical protein